MAWRRYPEGTYMQVVAGAALKRRREALGLTLRDVARAMGRPNTYSFIGRLEREVHMTCTPDFAQQLAVILQRDVDELFMSKVPNSGTQKGRSFRGGRAA